MMATNFDYLTEHHVRLGPVTRQADSAEVFHGRRWEEGGVYAHHMFVDLIKMLPKPPRFNQLGLSLLECWGERFDEVYAACENLLALSEGHPMAVECRNPRAIEKSALYVNMDVLCRDGYRYTFTLQLCKQQYSEPWLVGREIGLTPAASMMLTHALLELYFVPEGEIAAAHSKNDCGMTQATSKIRCPELQAWCEKAFTQCRQIIEISKFVEDTCDRVKKKLNKTTRDKLGYTTLEQDLFGLIHRQYNHWEGRSNTPLLQMAQEFTRIEHLPILKVIRKALDYNRAMEKDPEKTAEFPVKLIGCQSRKLKVT